MATPTFSLNYTVISDCNTDDWDAGDGVLDTDIKKQGTGSLSLAVRDGDTVGESGSWDMSASEQHLRLWFMHTFPANLKTKANGGIQLWISDGTNTNYYYASGSDTHEGAWELLQVDLAAPDIDNSVTMASITSAGWIIDHATAARNVTNTWWDYFVFGSGYEVYGGTGSDLITWPELAAADKAAGYGLVQELNGIYFLNGRLTIGKSDGTTDTYFDGGDNVVCFVPANESTALYKIESTQATTNEVYIYFNNTVLMSSSFGFNLDMNDYAIWDLEVIGTKIDNARQVHFQPYQEITGVNFYGCGEVDPYGADFDNCKFSDTIEDTSGALWVATEAKAEACSNLQFLGYAANSRYGAYIASACTDFDMDNWYFDDPNNTVDYAVYWAGTSGTLSINALNGTNLVTAGCTTAGGTIEIVVAPVTTEITVKDIVTGSVIVGARVLIVVADGVNFPYQDSVTATSSGTTATITHTAHGLATGDNIYISGANQNGYNGAFEITVTTVNAYTYTMAETATTPATGTIIATMAIINEITNASGIVTDTRSVGLDQDFTGMVRMSSSSPYYISSPVAGTIDNEAGFTAIIQLIKDE